MAIQLSSLEFQRLVSIIQKQPELSSQADRQNLITLAFGNAGKADIIRARLNLNSTPMVAAVEIVRFLSTFGQVEIGVEALGVFLDQILTNMGISDDADFIADVIQSHRLVSPPPPNLLFTDNLPEISTSITKDIYLFISYARPEQPIAEQVEVFLNKAGIQVFRDTRNILVGDNWDITIEDALKATTHMILLLSPASMPYRKEVHREWFYFDQQRKPILPVYVQDCILHSRMLAYNYIDARSNMNDAMRKLLSQLS